MHWQDKMDTSESLKLVATGMAGLFSGAAFYINAADHPSRMLLDTKSCRKHWISAYCRAKRFQGAFAFSGSVAGVTVYYLNRNSSDNSILWLVGSGALFSVMPFTALVMSSEIKKNLADDVFDISGETWVRNHIVKWNKQHCVRTLLGLTAFGCFLYALSKH